VVEEIAIPIGSAIVCGAGLRYLGNAAGAGRKRTIAGALAGGVLVGLVVADFTIDGAGDWWARHPTASATITGLLLLALTVLVIEAALERVLRAAEEQRWQAAGRTAASALLEALPRPIHTFQLDGLWPLTSAVERNDGANVPMDTAVHARTLADAIRSAVLDAAPVLTATDSLHQIYGEALNAAEASTELAFSIEEWELTHRQDVGLPTAASESARLAWWTIVVGPWDTLLASLVAFQSRAEAQLSVEPLEDDPWWIRSGSAEFVQARREYHEEFG
jgi:hypothetical protein